MTVAVRIIPCLDVAGGRVVKGVNFVSLKDAGDPVEQARIYDAQGADELCFLDITARHDGRGTLLDVVAPSASVCLNRKSVVKGKSVSVRVDLGGRLIIKTKNNT